MLGCSGLWPQSFFGSTGLECFSFFFLLFLVGWLVGIDWVGLGWTGSYRLGVCLVGKWAETNGRTGPKKGINSRFVFVIDAVRPSN